METKRMIWGNPELDVQKFVPQYCASSCTHQEDDTVTWEATCNSQQALVFFGYNPIESQDWTWDTSRGGCGKTHTFTTPASEVIGPNCYLLINYRASNYRTSPSEWWTATTGYNAYRTLKPTIVPTLIESGQLVKGYYNPDLDDFHGSWLVTAALESIHITS